MLVLSRHENQELILTTETGKTIRVVIVELVGNKVRVGIDAPAEINVMRAELLKRGAA